MSEPVVTPDSHVLHHDTAPNDWWKYTATSAVTAIVLMATAYFSGAKDWATEDDVRRIVAAEAPFVTERSRINSELEAIRKGLDNGAESDKQLANSLERLSGAVIRLEVLLERVMGPEGN